MAAEESDALVREATAAVLARLRAGAAATFRAVVGVSGRHVHLTAGDLATLLGDGATLTSAWPLNQPGQFAAQETVTVIGPGGSFARVRIVGPTRAKTVVELTAGDVATLGVEARPVPGEPFAVTLAGAAGVVRVTDGGVISRRHLHATAADAARFGLADGAVVSARVGVAGRRVVFEDVLVRVSDAAALELHLDRDEANACGAKSGDEAEIYLGSVTAVGPPRPVGRKTKTLLTEADVLAAHRRGTVPDVAGALVTPSARDALRKYFPGLVRD